MSYGRMPYYIFADSERDDPSARVHFMGTAPDGEQFSVAVPESALAQYIYTLDWIDENTHLATEAPSDGLTSMIVWGRLIREHSDKESPVTPDCVLRS